MSMVLDLYNVLDVTIREIQTIGVQKYITLEIKHTTHTLDINLYPDSSENRVAIHDERYKHDSR